MEANDMKEKLMEANDMKAMREALETLLNLAYEVRNINSEYGPKTSVPAQFVIDMAKSALSKPPRNCDVGSASEQADRYHNFTDRCNPCSYKGYARCAEDCPVHIKLTQEGHGELLCQLEWAQMPYEEGEAK